MAQDQSTVFQQLKEFLTQQSNNGSNPPLEQWYLTLLQSGRLPDALVPRLRELSELALANFLTDPEAIGAICTKFRSLGMAGPFPHSAKPAKLGSIAMD